MSKKTLLCFYVIFGSGLSTLTFAFTPRKTSKAMPSGDPNELYPGLNDPSLVYQSPDTANAFVDVRQGIPLIGAQMDTMVQVIHYFLPKDKRSSSSDVVWLDLGCGSGPLGRRLADEFPHWRGLFVDHSEPMLQVLKDDLSQSNVEAKVIRSDFATTQWLQDLSDAGYGTEHQFDVIVSGFAIHHVSHDRKRDLYQEIFQLLKPGGVFLNMEHVSSPSSYEDVENMFAATFRKTLKRHHEESGVAKSEEEVATMVRNDLEVDREANILATVEEQLQWLQAAGFAHVDCYFKFMILALLGGVKPSDK